MLAIPTLIYKKQYWANILESKHQGIGSLALTHLLIHI